MSNTSNSPSAAERKLTAASNGVAQSLPSKHTLVVDGVPLAAPEIEKQLEGYAQAHARVRLLRAQLNEAIAERRKLGSEARVFLLHLKTAVVSFLGEHSSLLETFGWKP